MGRGAPIWALIRLGKGQNPCLVSGDELLADDPFVEAVARIE
jgi:hypothetical protein